MTCRINIRRSTILLPLFLSVLSVLCAVGKRASAQEPVTFSLKDYRGHPVTLQDDSESQLVVLAFLGTECPLAKLYAVRLEELAGQYDRKDVAVIGLFSNVQDSVTELEAFARRHQLTYPLVKDLGNELADRVEAQRTPEVFLLDADRIVRYRGRIDDQYGVGVIRPAPTREELKTAIGELLAGRPVQVSRTQPVGCIIGRVRPVKENSPVTYSHQIARIFQNRCVECHREGEIAPFSLTSYDDVAGWGEMIGEVVREGRMPPWHADPHFGKFANDASLTAEERSQIEIWVAKGCPEGDPQQLPEPRTFLSDWQLPAEPDLVINMADQPFTVPADAGKEGVRYQNFWVDPQFTEEKWVLAAEVRPGNRAVVHHVLVFFHPEGRRGKAHGVLTAYVPGLRLNEPYPPGAAKRLPPGSWLRFQVHYTPIGSEQEDMSSVGILFANPENVTHEVRTTEIVQTGFALKPQLDNQEVAAFSRPSQVDVQLLSMSPHMHLRGKSFRYEALLPDGQEVTLLNVPRYDFNWQTRYCVEAPLTLPAGTRIHCTALFDNSPENLANPDPDVAVHWGDQSWDEMMIGYMDVLFPVGAVSSPTSRIFGQDNLISQRIDAQDVMAYLDANKDGVLTPEELTKIKVLSRAFDRIDQDKDGKITPEEVKQALIKYGVPQ